MENLNNAYIMQFKKKYNKKYTLIYTLIDDGQNFELWAKVEGYCKMVMLYGGFSKDLPAHTLNLDYAIDMDTLDELTGEEQEA